MSADAALVRLRAPEGRLPLGAIFGTIALVGTFAVGLLHLDHLGFPVCLFKAMTGLPCPACGSTGFYRLESLPGVIAVPAGNFADPAFAKPAKLYWTAHRHHWLTAPDGAVMIERQ